MRSYEPFVLTEVAQRARNYFTRMVDPRVDYLPYWFVQINEAPAYARHVRVDDAELVASWYEAIVAVQEILGEDDVTTACSCLASSREKGWRCATRSPRPCAGNG